MDFRRGDNSKISHYFQQAQHVSDPNEEEHFIGELKRVYDKISFKDFVEKFIECLKLCLIHPEDAPGVDAVLNFAAHFVASINSSGADDEETCPFLKKILEFVCANHGCDNHFVRSRICLFVDKLLCKLGNEVVIDELLYNKLVESMLERLKDKMPGIRVRAISAVYRLQDPFDPNCPVVKALSFHLSMDPSVEARRTILRKLAVAAHTLPTIVERIYDVKDFVRKDAFLVLSKCSMSRFTIKQRQMLLYSGLKDRDERVSKCVEKVLLPLWFDHAKNNFVNMLKLLDVETSTETSFLVLQILFKSSSPQTIMEQVKTHLDEDKLIDKLSPENAFFWRCAVHYFHNLDEDTLDEDKDTIMQAILPELTPLTNYIREYFLRNSEEGRQLEFWEQKQRQFILLQLLQLCNVHDLSDELGRSQLKQLCSDLLLSPQVKKDAVSVIVNVFSRILPVIDEFLDALVEIIMDLKEPFKDDENTDLSEEEADEEKAEKNEIVKISPEVLTKCLTIVVEFLQNKNVTVFNPCLRSLVTTFVCPALEAQDTASRVLALHALSNSCLLDVDLAQQYFLLFCFQVANDDMCLVALKGIFDLLLFYGLSTFKLSDQIDDNEEKKKDDEPEKKKRKLKGAMVEENSFVSSSGEANTSTNEIMSDLTHQSTNLVTMLMSLLDSYSSDIRNVTVEGLCKLIIGGRITSVSLLSKLIILWFSPVSEEDYILRQQLGTFFNVYASSFAGSHYMFQQAFLPALKALYDAPMDSQLHEIDPDDVAKLLISLMVVRMSKEKGPNPHNSLALGICKEILSTYSANLGNVPVLVRSLLPLQLSFEEPGFIESFKDLCQQVLELLENANNKILAKYMQKMLFKIEGAETDENMNPADINNTEQPMETTDGNTTTVDDMLNASGENVTANEGSKTKDSSVKGSPKRKGAKKTAAKTPVRISDKENTNSDDADEPDVFDQNDDSDVDEPTITSRKKSAEKSSLGSASPTTPEKEEYSLSRINLKRKKALEEKKIQKTQPAAEKGKSRAKKSVDSEEDESDEEKEGSTLTRRSARQKGVDTVPSPPKKSRLQASKSKKSVRGKENEKVESSSDEADDESDNVSVDSPDDKKKITGQSKVGKSSKHSPEKKSEKEVGGRSSRRGGRKVLLEETPAKKTRQTPGKGLRSTRKGVSNKDANQSSDENVSSDLENHSRERSEFPDRKADAKSVASKPNKATPRKLIQVENIGTKKEFNKRKSDGGAVESSPRTKKLSEINNQELSKNASGRSTRSARVDLSVPSTPSKNTQVPKSSVKLSPAKSSADVNRRKLIEVGNKISKSPESPKQSESKSRLKDLEILEEISRRSPRSKQNVEKISNKNSKSPKHSPLKKKTTRARQETSDDSSDEQDSEEVPSPITAKPSVSKESSKVSKTPDSSSKTVKTPKTKKLSRDSDDSSDEEDSEISPLLAKQSNKNSKTSETETKKGTPSKSVTSGAEKSSHTRAKSDVKNSRKSLRIALYKVDIPVGRRGSTSLRKSSARRSQSVFITPENKKVEVRSRSVSNTPSKRNSLPNKNEERNADSLLRQVLTPRRAPSSKDVEKLEKTVSPSQKSESRASRSSVKSPTVKDDRVSKKSKSSPSPDQSPIKKISSKILSPEGSSPSDRRSSRENVTSSHRSRLTNKTSEDLRNKYQSPSRSSVKKSDSRILSPKKDLPESNRKSKSSPSPDQSPIKKISSKILSPKGSSPSDRRSSRENVTSSRRSRSTNKTSEDLRNKYQSPSRSSVKKSDSRTLSPKKDLPESNRKSSRDRDTSPRRSRSINKTPVIKRNTSSARKAVAKEIEKLPKKTPNKEPELRPSLSLRKKVLTPLKSPVVKSVASRRSSSARRSSPAQKQTPQRTTSVSNRSRSSSTRQNQHKRSMSVTPKAAVSPAVRGQVSKRLSGIKTPSNPGRSPNIRGSTNSKQPSGTRKKVASPVISPSSTKKNNTASESAKKKSETRKRSLSLPERSVSIRKKTPSPLKSPSSAKRSTAKSVPVKKRSETPKRSLSPSKKSVLVLKKTPIPKKSLTPPSRKSDVSRSRSVSKKSLSPKSPVMKKSATPKTSPSPKKITTSRQTLYAKKEQSTSSKRTPSPMKKGSSKESPASTKKIPKKSLLPIRKMGSKPSQAPKTVASSSKKTSLIKKNVSRNNLSVLSKNRLVVKKSNSRQSIIVMKKVPVKYPTALKKIDSRKSMPVKKTSQSPKRTILPTKKPVKQTGPPKKGQSMTAGEWSGLKVAGTRSRPAPRVRKTPSKLTL